MSAGDDNDALTRGTRPGKCRACARWVGNETDTACVSCAPLLVRLADLEDQIQQARGDAANAYTSLAARVEERDKADARVAELDSHLSLVLAEAHRLGHYGTVHASAELVLQQKRTAGSVCPPRERVRVNLPTSRDHGREGVLYEGGSGENDQVKVQLDGDKGGGWWCRKHLVAVTAQATSEAQSSLDPRVVEVVAAAAALRDEANEPMTWGRIRTQHNTLVRLYTAVNALLPLDAGRPALHAEFRGSQEVGVRDRGPAEDGAAHAAAQAGGDGAPVLALDGDRGGRHGEDLRGDRGAGAPGAGPRDVTRGRAQRGGMSAKRTDYPHAARIAELEKALRGCITPCQWCEAPAAWSAEDRIGHAYAPTFCDACKKAKKKAKKNEKQTYARVAGEPVWENWQRLDENIELTKILSGTRSDSPEAPPKDD